MNKFLKTINCIQKCVTLFLDSVRPMQSYSSDLEHGFLHEQFISGQQIPRIGLKKKNVKKSYSKAGVNWAHITSAWSKQSIKL